MVKEIQLTQNKSSIVDDNDYEWLNERKWYADKQSLKHIQRYYAGYTEVKKVNGKIKKKHHLMHREIMKKKLIDGKNIDLFVDFVSSPRKFPIDHINGNTLDNRKNNLRIVSLRENSLNRHHLRTSKYPGVCWHKQNKKWDAQININGKKIRIGMFDKEKDAAKAYQNKLKELTSINPH